MVRFRVTVVAALCFVGARTARADLEPQPTPTSGREEAPPTPAAPGQLTRAPELLVEVPAVFPPQAFAERRSGEVILLITIAADGAVSDVSVGTSSGHKDLDEAAVAAARGFQFRAAEIDGKPAAVAIEFRTGFTLDEEVVEVPVEVAPPGPDAAPVAPDGSTGSADASGGTSGPVNIEGLVRSAVAKQPIADVEVGLAVGGSEQTTTTDEAGRFRFRGVPPGEGRLTFALSGWTTSFVDVVVAAKERTDVIAVLEPRDSNVFETVIREKRAQAEVTRVALSREEVRSVPGTFGDPIRVIENLPGLARAPLAGGQLIVRGSNPEDSAVLFDGIPIPNLYHFQGLKSVVNAEFLESINFYPGGFPAKYGRATAGVVDVTSRKLESDAMRGALDVNFMDAGFFLSIPLDDAGLENTTVAIAARRSYIDAFLPTVLDVLAGPTGQTILVLPVYWDYQAKLHHKLDSGELSLFAFGSDDDLQVASTGLGDNAGLSFGTHTAFHRLSGRWLWRGDGITNVVQPFAGLSTSDLAIGDSAGINDDTWSWGLREEVRVQPLPGIKLAAGLDYLGDQTTNGGTVPLSFDIGGHPRVVQRNEVASSFANTITRHGVGVWADAELELFPGLLVVPGLRADFTRVSFASDVLDDGTVTEPAEIDLTSVDPRLALRFEIFPDSTILKASGGLYHQPPSSTVLSPDTGNPDLLQPGALQAIVGVEQEILAGLSVDVQGYITQRFDLVQGAVSVGGGGAGGGPGGGGGGPDAEALTELADNDGSGRTIGLEILLRQQLSKSFYGWIAYTLSRTTVDTDKASDDQLLAAFDQTHILTIVAQGKLPWGFGLGGRVRYVTGNPTSVPAGSFHDLDKGSYTAIPSAANDTRQPDFFQLDVRLDRRFSFDDLAFTAYVDLLNATNNANAESTLSDYRSNETSTVTGLPFLPVFGITGEF